MSELGGYLKKLRGNISLREAAKRSGLSHSYINSLESGVHPKTGVPINPSPEILKGLAKAYNHPYKDLMVRAGYSYEDGTEESKEETEADLKRKKGLEYIARIRDEKTLDLAIELLEKLAKE